MFTQKEYTVYNFFTVEYLYCYGGDVLVLFCVLYWKWIFGKAIKIKVESILEADLFIIIYIVHTYIL